MTARCTRPRESDPPIVTITYPTDGATALGSTPGATVLTLQADITETAIYSMTAEVNGHAPVSVGYYHTSPQSYASYIQVDSTEGLISGTNTVRVNVWDFDRPQNTGSASTTFRFQVRPFPPPIQLDVWPTAFEVTQSIDYGARRLTQNDRFFTTSDGYEVYVPGPGDTPLLQGKATVIRVYGAVTGSSGVVNNVPAMVEVDRAQCTTNCLIATEQPPLQNPTTPLLNGISLAPLGTPASEPGSQVPTLSKSWNFLLQPDWTNQDLIIKVYVNTGAYQNFSRPPSVPECSSNQELTCTHNNTLRLHLHFQQGPQITVDPVVIHVTGTYKGNTFNNVTPSDNQIDAIFQQINELYPARVVRGPRYDRTVSPAINRDDLLDIIKNYNGNSGREMFIGIFPGDQGTFAANAGVIPGSFVAGYGAVGGRGAWANADNPIDPAHELAHNIGFDHWGCENGVTADECGVFPIAHAGIGVVGFDIANWRVIPPGDNSSNSTPHAHDFMSYGQLCGLFGGGAGCDTGEWVSWYTYGILLDHPAVDSYDTDDPPALLVSGRIDPNGLARLRPIYQVGVNHPISDTIVEDDPNNVYTMQGYDSHGNTLFIHNFEPQKLDIHGPDYDKAFIFDEAVPVMPDLQRLAVLKGPNVIGDIRNPEPGITPTVHIIAPATGNTWPANTPQTIRWTQGPADTALTALVQYSPDGGATRITLGRDITATELTVNPDELPGSTNAFVYVQVSDGLNTAIDQVGPLTVAPKPPSAHIVTPHAGARVLAHVPVTLEGSGFDRQETLTDTQFKWSSNLDGALGTGRQLSTSNLSVGLHTLTLTATDSAGRTGHDSVQVRILNQRDLYLPSVGRGQK